MGTHWILPEIDETRCTRCGQCAAHCPTHAVVMRASGPVIVDPKACTYCGFCESLCPADAVALFYTIVWEDVSI
jgi:MinD superfamily P-loop ATPase